MYDVFRGTAVIYQNKYILSIIPKTVIILHIYIFFYSITHWHWVLCEQFLEALLGFSFRQRMWLRGSSNQSWEAQRQGFIKQSFLKPGSTKNSCLQIYSRLRSLLPYKFFDFFFYLGWSGSFPQLRQNIVKVVQS